MFSRAQVLTSAKFGSRIAEDEADLLKRYFVETEHWRKILAGEVDIIFGAKGAGKSALYSLVVGLQEEYRLGKRTIFLAAENPRGTPAFRDLTTEPPLSEEEFRGLWKLYFLTLAANYMRRALEAMKFSDNDAYAVISLLAAHGLLAPDVTLVARLKAVLSYLRQRVPQGSKARLPTQTLGLTYTAKIGRLAEPTAEQRLAGYRSVDDLLRQLNKAFEKPGITVWLLLDRLDVAFADSDQLEGNALRALLGAYLDILLNLSHIKRR